ncbi:MAG: hypothetical protein LDL33_12040 [Desulfomonile sp.]|nr:hypothetical protein [Desulfomonile sp.]
MIPPVVLAMFAGAALIGIEGITRRGLLLLMLLIPFYYLGAEVLARQVTVGDEGITIRKLLWTVRLEWRHIETLDAVRTGHKVFLILLPFEGRPTFVTNTLKPFNDLTRQVLERVPESRISPKARELLEGAPSKIGPVIQAWIVCLVLAGCAVGRLAGYG